MRKLFVISLFALSGCGVAQAQSTAVKRDTTIEVSTDRYQVVSNRFGDNWFIGAQAGAQIFFGDHDKPVVAKAIAYHLIAIGRYFYSGITLYSGGLCLGYPKSAKRKKRNNK